MAIILRCNPINRRGEHTNIALCNRCIVISVVTIPNVAMRYVPRYLGHDAIRIAILVYRVSECLDLQKKKNVLL